MFTGIIEGVGKVEALDTTGEFQTLRIRAGNVLDGITTGDSIAVNGVCLTVRSFITSSFTAELARETLDRTNLGSLRAGAIVNLERPMRADGRFDGHMVQGHVDGVGQIRQFSRHGDAWTLQIEVPERALRYIVEKGSIAVDGISLTVAAVKPPMIEIAIIPHTYENTNLKHARPGDAVNLEFDILAKYVERMLNRD